VTDWSPPKERQPRGVGRRLAKHDERCRARASGCRGSPAPSKPAASMERSSRMKVGIGAVPGRAGGPGSVGHRAHGIPIRHERARRGAHAMTTRYLLAQAPGSRSRCSAGIERGSGAGPAGVALTGQVNVGRGRGR